VEPEPVHFEWMRLHFSDNGLDPAKHSLIHGALSDAPGEVLFYIESKAGHDDPGQWYGQSLTKDYEVLEQIEAETYCGFTVRRHISGFKSISVPSVNLADLLKDVSKVDLIDIDIQGEEGSAIRSAVDLLTAKVKRMHIGTHSREIEIGLRELLSVHGWICQADYSGDATHETPFGAITFQDGAQSWLNPRLCRPWWSPARWFSAFR
jgi:FkbM family methyltransferase